MNGRSVHFTSCFLSLLKLVTLLCNVLNVTNKSNMFLFDSPYPNFDTILFLYLSFRFLEKMCTKIAISEIRLMKEISKYIFYNCLQSILKFENTGQCMFSVTKVNNMQ